MKRPIVVALLGSILGIVCGLYLYNIAFFLCIISVILMIFCVIKKNKKILLILFFFCIFNIYSSGLEKRYINVQEEFLKKSSFQVEILEITKIEDSLQEYVVKEKSGKRLILKTRNKEKYDVGTSIYVKGKYIKPEKARNDKGFNYDLYLKTKKIFGSVQSESTKVISKKGISIVEKIRKKVEEGFYKYLKKEKAELAISLILGNNNNLSNEIKDNFKNAGLSHLLAVSGSHVAYFIMFLNFIFNGKKHKRLSQIVTILFMIIYIFITNEKAPVCRACIMCIYQILASILYEKPDWKTGLSICLFLSIIKNPYCIFDIGLILSYSGVIGIYALYQKVYNFLLPSKNIGKIKKKIIEMVSLSTCVNIVLIPITIYTFHTFCPYFLLNNILITPVFSILMILIISSSFIFIFTPFLFQILVFLLEKSIDILNLFLLFMNSMPYSKIYIAAPHFISYIVYIILILLFKYRYNFKLRNITPREDRKLIFFIKLIKRKIYIILNKNYFLSVILIITIFISFFFISSIPKDLQIHFIDVRQGDCTYLEFPKGKNMLIDGGGSLDKEKYDVGKSITLPYLLSHHISKIDYLVISHFDLDHCQGLEAIVANIKVSSILIGNIQKETESYMFFVDIAKKKNIPIIYLKSGDRIKIENNVYLDVIWPQDEKISENEENNNALVFKVIYKDFSILFTGDIEKVAEEKILEKSGDKLKSTVLKVAHHGSKTSSIKEFLQAVYPKISLIGVGKNNKFGHPSEITIKNLETIGSKIYRTDEDGQISIKTNGKNVITIITKHRQDLAQNLATKRYNIDKDGVISEIKAKKQENEREDI